MPRKAKLVNNWGRCQTCVFLWGDCNVRWKKTFNGDLPDCFVPYGALVVENEQGED